MPKKQLWNLENLIKKKTIIMSPEVAKQVFATIWPNAYTVFFQYLLPRVLWSLHSKPDEWVCRVGLILQQQAVFNWMDVSKLNQDTLQMIWLPDSTARTFSVGKLTTCWLQRSFLHNPLTRQTADIGRFLKNPDYVLWQHFWAFTAKVCQMIVSTRSAHDKYSMDKVWLGLGN